MNDFNKVKKPTNNIYSYIILFGLVTFVSYLGYRNFSPTKTQNIEENTKEIVKEYISAHPEEIITSLQKHQQKQIKHYEELAKASIQEKAQELQNDVLSPVYSSGHETDITIITFYDASCGYCKTSNKALVELLDSDDKIKVIYKEFPILGKNSENVARVLLAVFNTQPKMFYDFNNDIMSQNEVLTNDMIKELLNKHRFEYEAIEKEMNNPQVTEELEKVRKLAMDLNIQGTPAYIIEGEFYPGSMDVITLKKIIENKRQTKK